jgi:hypothetical protein
MGAFRVCPTMMNPHRKKAKRGIGSWVVQEWEGFKKIREIQTGNLQFRYFYEVTTD